MGVRFRETRDKIGDHEDRMDSMYSALKQLKEKITYLEERLKKAESILDIIHYESNPAYLEGLKIKYDKIYGGKDEPKSTR